MTINVPDPFKFQTAKTFDKTRIDRDVHTGQLFSSCDLHVFSKKRIFKFGTMGTVVDVDDNLAKAKPLDHTKSVRSSLLNACADIHPEKQKKILSKVKLVKDSVTKLFKPSGRGAVTFPSIDSFVVLAVENRNTTQHPSTPPPILQQAKSETLVVTAQDSIPPTGHSSEATASPITYGESTMDEDIDTVVSTSFSIVEASISPPTLQHFMTPKSPFDLPSTLLPNELHTIEEEDGSVEVAVNTEQRELAASASRMSHASSVSAVTVYLSSNTFSALTTASEVGLGSSETSASAIATSFATSVDAEDNPQLLSGALRGLRRVPNYEDLRNVQIIANHGLSCSDMSCGSSDCGTSDEGTPSIHAAPLRRSVKCDNLRRSLLSFGPEMPTRQTHKSEKFRAWVSARCRESPHNTQKTTTSRAPIEVKKVIPVPRSRHFLRNLFHLSSSARVHASEPSTHPHLPPQTSSVWSCAKIAQSSSKAKRRRRMTKRSMRALKTQLDSLDIDPWY